jgi:hypothetical protein
MKKLFWLTLTVGVFCLASNAQEANDSAYNLQARQVITASVFTDFSYTIKDINKVLLQWKIDSGATNDYFMIEHGKDTAHFETLGIIKRISSYIQYELLDNNALNGFRYYRIKTMDSAGLIVYSKILQVISGRTEFKFYPNPTDKMLIIETEHFSDLQILNSMGSILLSKPLQAGIQIINVSSLERGEYILRVADKINNKIILEHLLKN